MDDVNVVNPAVPSTVGALLAEEWTINPLATLPSFLEMFMMDEASRSAQKSLDAAMDLLRQKLAAVTTASTDDRTGGNSSQPQQTSSTTTTSTATSSIISTSSSAIISYVRSFLRRSAGKFSSTVARLLQKYGPEISCLILYTMERHCLRSQACATISESLYGGRLAKVDLSNNNATNHERKLLPLNDRDKTRLALLVALGPYVRVRLLKLYKNVKQDTELAQQEQQSTAEESATTEGFSRLSLLQKLQKLYAFVYPMLHVSLSSLDMMYQWRYLLGHSVFFHPYSHFLGLVVRRVTQEDAPESQTKGSTSTTSSNDAAAVANSIASTTLPSVPPSLESSLQPSDTLRNAAVFVLSSAVVLSWVFQFRSEYRRQRQELIQRQLQQQERQQQQQEETTNPSEANNLNTNANRMVMIQNSVPPPPTSGIKNSNALPPHLCPLCRRERMHPTASTSGFVFCYKCLLQSVKETGKCPVTGRDCREAQLLRLYEPNAAANSGG